MFLEAMGVSVNRALSPDLHENDPGVRIASGRDGLDRSSCHFSGAVLD